MYYDIFDYTSLKYLAKLIIGDYTLPPKTSVELFGNTIKYVDANMLFTDVDTLSPTSALSSPKEKPKKTELKLKDVEDNTEQKGGCRFDFFNTLSDMVKCLPCVECNCNRCVVIL